MEKNIKYCIKNSIAQKDIIYWIKGCRENVQVIYVKEYLSIACR